MESKDASFLPLGMLGEYMLLGEEVEKGVGEGVGWTLVGCEEDGEMGGERGGREDGGDDSTGVLGWSRKREGSGVGVDSGEPSSGRSARRCLPVTQNVFISPLPCTHKHVTLEAKLGILP